MLKENAVKVFKNIENAAKKTNKTLKDITVVAATKMQEAATIICLNDIGIYISGENKVQELLSKYDRVDNTIWHFIGRLQTNKVKYIIDKVELIHSVDRLNLCQEIDRQAKKCGKVMEVLLEVNVANQDTKAGFSILEIEDVLSEICNKFDNIKVVGLMAILPYFEDVSKNKNYYLQMSKVYDRIKEYNNNFKYLSMGMSNDYEVAIECGANMVRLGTCIFGERNYN